MSNRERIARAAEEARAAALEKAQKKAEKATRAQAKPAPAKSEGSKGSTASVVKPPRPKRVAKPTRMKIVWEICSGNGEVVKTYPYSEKAAAEAELLRLSNAKREHVLRNTKVPME